MNINRNNYEEFFLLYIDKELGADDRRAVEEFVAANPDLKQELDMLQDTVFQPEAPAKIDFKSTLFRSSGIDQSNCEEFFVLYGDNELDNREKESVEQFVYKHPEHQANFELIQQAKLQPEAHIVFPDKNLLYRSEKDEKVIVMRWWKIAAAAAILLFVSGGTWYIMSGNKNDAGYAVKENTRKTENSVTPKRDTQSPQRKIEEQTNPQAAEQIAKADKKNSTTVEPVNNDVAVKPVKKSLQKVSEQSNNNLASSVQPKNSDKIELPEIVVENAIDKTPDPVSALANNTIDKSNNKNIVTEPSKVNTTETASADKLFANASNDDLEFEPSGKKTKMRGLFRKVSRVFDKATNRESSETDKELHIAGFSVALK